MSSTCADAARPYTHAITSIRCCHNEPYDESRRLQHLHFQVGFTCLSTRIIYRQISTTPTILNNNIIISSSIRASTPRNTLLSGPRSAFLNSPESLDDVRAQFQAKLPASIQSAFPGNRHGELLWDCFSKQPRSIEELLLTIYHHRSPAAFCYSVLYSNLCTIVTRDNIKSSITSTTGTSDYHQPLARQTLARFDTTFHTSQSLTFPRPFSRTPWKNWLDLSEYTDLDKQQWRR